MEKSNQNNKPKGLLRNAKIIRAFIALFLAIVIWFYINGTASSIMLRSMNNIPVRISNADVLKAKGLFISEDGIRYVNLRLQGTSNNLDEINYDNISASVDVSEIGSPGKHDLQIVIQGLPNSVILSEQNPEKLSLDIDRLENKEYEVSVIPNGKPAAGHKLSDAKTKEKVRISGGNEALSKIDGVIAKADINGLDSDSQQYAAVKAYDKDGNEIENVTIEPYKVFVEITLTAISQ